MSNVNESEVKSLVRDTVFCISDEKNAKDVINFMNWMFQNRVTFKIIEWKGPAGGNPFIEYYGTQEKLDLLEKLFFGETDSPIVINW
jgi:hypothetical protein